MLIIDEVSMVSSLNLVYIHLRMSELFGSDTWFGGMNVLFVGDLLQLQPVNGNPIFETVHKKAILNERQKKDGVFSTILDSVRRGNLTDEITATLQDRVSSTPISEKFAELQGCGMTPVCLFPTRKQCDKVNGDMLSHLETKMHVIPCIHEIDETKSTAKWQEKAAQQLEKLNRDCNNTAGLEAVLNLAVGARVMLRRNIDVKAGLLNGAIGTLLAVLPSRVTIKFDHLSAPCDIKKVKGKFMVLKNYHRNLPFFVNKTFVLVNFMSNIIRLVLIKRKFTKNEIFSYTCAVYTRACNGEKTDEQLCERLSCLQYYMDSSGGRRTGVHQRTYKCYRQVCDEVIIGHLPKRISKICSLFLRRGGSITCTVTGGRRYSGDLGGLEIPCTLLFKSKGKEIQKLRCLKL